MRLAGEDELHRALRVVDHGGQLFDVGQNQVGALVGGKAARKADGERIRAEHAPSLCNISGGLAAALGLLDGAAAHKFEEPRFQAEMGFPEFAVVDVLDAFPDAWLRRCARASRFRRWRS